MNPYDDRATAPLEALLPRRESRSLLVRLWAEPREIEGRPGRFRGLVRDLKSGAETYVSEPEQLAELMVRHAHALEGGLEPVAP